MNEKGEVVLQDPVSKVIYKFDDTAKAKQYVGKQVKVTGKLFAESNTIHLQGIELISWIYVLRDCLRRTRHENFDSFEAIRSCDRSNRKFKIQGALICIQNLNTIFRLR